MSALFKGLTGIGSTVNPQITNEEERRRRLLQAATTRPIDIGFKQTPQIPSGPFGRNLR